MLILNTCQQREYALVLLFQKSMTELRQR